MTIRLNPLVEVNTGRPMFNARHSMHSDLGIDIVTVDANCELRESLAKDARLAARGFSSLRVPPSAALEVVATAPRRQPGMSPRLASHYRQRDVLELATNLQERRNPIMKWSLAFSVLMGTAALLLPLMAAAESHLQTGAASAKLSATAHVDFEIIVPQVLYLRVGGSNGRGRDAETAIMSNSRNVTLNATVRRSADDGSDTSTHNSMNSAVATRISASTANRPVSGEEAGGNVILSAAARKVIARDEQCMLGDAHAAAADPHGSVSLTTAKVVCTASMP